MELSQEMQAATTAVFCFLERSGVPRKVIRSGERSGVWLPLAKLLRACKYHSPVRETGTEPLDHVETVRLLISGKIQAAVEMAEFARLIAPFCQAPAVQEFAIEFLNNFVIRPYKSSFVDEESKGDLAAAVRLLELQEELSESLGDPGLVNMLKRPDSKFVGHKGKLRLARAAPDPDTGSFAELVDCFLSMNPEWSHDIQKDVLLPEGRVESRMTPQAAFAFGQWFVARYPAWVSDEALAFQARLEQQIIQEGQGFGPRHSTDS